MTARFICPHCHTPVNPHAMERAYSDLAEYRICPLCDEAVFFALRDTPRIPSWLQRDGRDASADSLNDSNAPVSAKARAGAQPEWR